MKENPVRGNACREVVSGALVAGCWLRWELKRLLVQVSKSGKELHAPEKVCLGKQRLRIERARGACILIRGGAAVGINDLVHRL